MKKMTPKQVSALSDIELNRAMIWLYTDRVDSLLHNCFQQGLEELSEEQRVSDDGNEFIINLCEWEYEVNFLKDYLSWDLTMPLAVEYGVWLQPDHIGDGKLHAYDDVNSAANKNPLRAICEVLVLLKVNK